MNSKEALNVIDILKKWSEEKKISFIIAGSVGYRSALKYNSELEKCDDIDCIFIYDNINQIAESPIFTNEYYNLACNTVPDKADMFSVKEKINDIKISADFVSADYLKVLSEEEISGISKYRFKLTNAVEVPENIYFDYYGRQTCYHKVWEDYNNCRIYKLPIHVFDNDAFFQGALLSKFVFNPAMVNICYNHEKYICLIQKRVKDYCPEDGSLCKAYRKCNDFSDETKSFLEDRKNGREKNDISYGM